MKDLVTRLPRRDIEERRRCLPARSQEWAASRAGRHAESEGYASLRPSPQLIFRPRRVQQTVLILQDISQRCDPPRDASEFSLSIFEGKDRARRWSSMATISVTTQRPNGPLVTARRAVEAARRLAVMVISAGFGVAATLTLPNRAWWRRSGSGPGESGSRRFVSGALAYGRPAFQLPCCPDPSRAAQAATIPPKESPPPRHAESRARTAAPSPSPMWNS